MFTDDDDIDRQLRADLNVDPSINFGTSVLGRIEEDRQLRGVPAIWLAAAAAIMVLVTGIWFVSSRSAAVDVAPAVVSSDPSAAPRPYVSQGDTTEPPKPAADARLPPRSPRVATRQPHVAVAEPGPEVIVPAGQLALIRRLVRQANLGVLRVPEVERSSIEPTELVVSPVTIEPLAVAGAQPGGANQGAKGLH